MLASALPCMPNLRDFRLGVSAEHVIRYAPDFAQALLRCNNLTFLSLDRVETDASAAFGDAVRAMSSSPFPPLKTLALSGGFSIDQGIRSLLSVASQTTTLKLSCMKLGAYLTVLGNAPRLSFPLVSTLDLANCTVSLRELSAAFPNVENLQLTYISDLGPPIPQERVFPKLSFLDGCYGDTEIVLMSHPGGGRLHHLLLDDNGWGGEGAATFAPLQGAPHLKTLLFFIYDNEPLLWWKELARMTPELSTLCVTFIKDEVKDIHIVRPSLFH
jgi:hypothetical protein